MNDYPDLAAALEVRDRLREGLDELRKLRTECLERFGNAPQPSPEGAQLEAEIEAKLAHINAIVRAEVLEGLAEAER